MDSNGFETLQQALDRCDAVVHGMIERDVAEIRALHDAVRRLAATLGSGVTAKLSLTLSVRDRHESRELPWEVVAFASDGGDVIYDATEDSSARRYEIEGRTSVVPHDKCPRCWQSWPRKLEKRSCDHCGLTIGDGCTIVVEHGTCPQCEEGTVSGEAPVCEECGYKLDSRDVAWR